jgi:long-chain acyl-CoA synthetase
LFCSTDDIFIRATKEVLPNTPLLSDSFCFDTPNGEPHSLTTAIESAKGKHTRVISPTPDDLAGLIYTSGTTGKPKGVELTHDNFVSNIYSVRSMADDPLDFIRSSDRSLAFLPWAHSYGQTTELWCTVSHGGSMGICRGIPHILEDLSMVQPTVLFAVPSLYKKVYDGVQNLIGSSSPTKQKLMRAALDLGKKKKEAGGNLGLIDGLKYKVLDSLVTSKIRGRFGGKLRHGFVGGAATPKDIVDFMVRYFVRLKCCAFSSYRLRLTIFSHTLSRTTLASPSVKDTVSTIFRLECFIMLPSCQLEIFPCQNQG